ncbi:MAG: CDP-6-deoxy-delta-3,4-glucoseen reductase [Comamonadaceae bacterium CG1_02_60_18]|nr:MAG: CDP-6-deoxy-delta-3,4-glucoseen reductase [Comamonadaceae bacterium CG1_02_60_18]PIQ56774.1 MAG: CDP-6-deoxy-delta-3,4-glucoseen reductase [Comamonadaceae bacterium CG12_big_fil_rev_8_21_14_0_65_59_15]
MNQPTSHFHVSVAPSGRSFTVATDETILAAGIRQGVNLPYGCKDGACGSCKCKLLSGQVTLGAHQDKALSADEAAQGYILTCCATAASDVALESRQVTPEGALPVKKMPTRVRQMDKLSDDVMRVQLQLPASEAFLYRAGQYVEFLLKDGKRRSYSMANAPHHVDQGLELHIRHMPGGLFTDQVFGTLKEKDILRIEGPYGSFYLREDSAKPIILLASGTGFAPIKALIEHMQHAGIQRPATLYWGGRHPADLYLDNWVRSKLTELPWLRYVPVISDALPNEYWSGRSGFVHLAVLQDTPDLSGHQVYACGAPIVVDSARRDYLAAGLPADEFFADAFTTEADKTDV